MPETLEALATPTELDDRILAALAPQTEPVNVAHIARLLGNPQAPALRIQSALAALVDRGRLFGYAASPARAPTLFSSRDFREVAGNRMVALVAEHSPLAEKELIESVRRELPRSLPASFSKASLAALVAQGRLFEHPGRTAKSKGYALAPFESLEQRLLRLLESGRHAGLEAYPTPLAALLSSAGAAPDDRQVKRLLRPGSAFSERVFRTAKHPAAPVLFREDIDSRIDFGRLAQFALEVARTSRKPAVAPMALARKLDPAIRSRFLEHLKRCMREQTLPATIGWLAAPTPSLFLISDLEPASLRRKLDGSGSQMPVATEPEPPSRSALGAGEKTSPSTLSSPSAADPEAFGRRFDMAFAAIDRRHGLRNFVSLAELRPALPEFSREQFDAGFRELRRLGRYSLNASQGRYGLSEADRKAAIIEEGVVLLYVSREQSAGEDT